MQMATKWGSASFTGNPKCYNNWDGYTKGAFDDNGVPTEALNAFSEN